MSVQDAAAAAQRLKDATHWLEQDAPTPENGVRWGFLAKEVADLRTVVNYAAALSPAPQVPQETVQQTVGPSLTADALEWVESHLGGLRQSLEYIEKQCYEHQPEPMRGMYARAAAGLKWFIPAIEAALSAPPAAPSVGPLALTPEQMEAVNDGVRFILAKREVEDDYQAVADDVCTEVEKRIGAPPAAAEGLYTAEQVRRLIPDASAFLHIGGDDYSSKADAEVVMAWLETLGIEYGVKRTINSATGERKWYVWFPGTVTDHRAVRSALASLSAPTNTNTGVPKEGEQ